MRYTKTNRKPLFGSHFITRINAPLPLAANSKYCYNKFKMAAFLCRPGKKIGQDSLIEDSDGYER